MPLHVFPTVPWFHIRLFGGLVPHFRAVLCHRMQYLCVSVWILYKPVEECVVREMEVKGFILEDISVRCLQPLSSYDLISFSFFLCIMFFMFYQLFMILSACARRVAGLIRWTLQHWKLFLWGFDLRSASLYFARPPSAAFTFVSPLLVRPRYEEAGQSVWWIVLRFLFIFNIYLFILVYIFIVLLSFLGLFCVTIVQLMHLCKYCLLLFKGTLLHVKHDCC